MSHFEKVSFEQWKADCGVRGLPESGLKEWYNAIKLPKQATAASAGCDFYMPFSLNFEGGSSFRIALVTNAKVPSEPIIISFRS